MLLVCWNTTTFNFSLDFKSELLESGGGGLWKFILKVVSLLMAFQLRFRGVSPTTSQLRVACVAVKGATAGGGGSASEDIIARVVVQLTKKFTAVKEFVKLKVEYPIWGSMDTFKTQISVG